MDAATLYMVLTRLAELSCSSSGLCGERTTAITISVAGVLVWLLGRVLRYFFSGKFSKLGKFGS